MIENIAFYMLCFMEGLLLLTAAICLLMIAKRHILPEIKKEYDTMRKFSFKSRGKELLQEELAVVKQENESLKWINERMQKDLEESTSRVIELEDFIGNGPGSALVESGRAIEETVRVKNKVIFKLQRENFVLDREKKGLQQRRERQKGTIKSLQKTIDTMQQAMEGKDLQIQDLEQERDRLRAMSSAGLHPNRGGLKDYENFARLRQGVPYPGQLQPSAQPHAQQQHDVPSNRDLHYWQEKVNTKSQRIKELEIQVADYWKVIGHLTNQVKNS